jgi:peptide/nickel transport system substrate-binding protein
MTEGSYWQRVQRARYDRRAVVRGGALTGVGLAAAGLVGCGSSNNNNGSSTSGATKSASTAGGAPSSGSSPAAGASVAVAQPKPGGVISVPVSSDPQALDIHQVSTYVAVWPEAPCYNQLLQIDPNDETDSKITADLADKWETPDNGLSYIFHLHPGIKFHDGSPFTSADIKANLDWIKTPANKKPSPRSGVLGSITGIETSDDNTVTIKLSQPNPSLLLNLASDYFAIGSKAVIDASGDLGDKFIGTGPFKLKSYQRGNSVQLEKNPNYWVTGRPYLDGLNFYIVPDPNTSFTNFLGGQYQQYHEIKPENVSRVKSETGGKAEVIPTGSYTRQVIFFNTKKKPWDDIRVRQAVSLALDRGDAINTAQGGFGELGGYMRASGSWGLPVDQIKAIPGYDKGNIDQAKALLQQAGVQTPIKGTLLSRNDFTDIYTWTQQALTKVGINLDLDPRDNAAAYDAAYGGQFDLMAWTVSIVIDDPDATFAEISTSKAVRNWSALTDPEIDSLYAAQTKELDNGKRKQIVNQMDKKALSIFQTLQLYFVKYNEGLYTNVKDFKFHSSLYTNRRLQDAWLAK